MKRFIIFFVIGIFLLAFIVGRCNNDDIENVEEDGTEYVEDGGQEEAFKETVIDVAEETNPQVVLNSVSFEIPRSIRSIPEQILVRLAYTTSYNKDTKCPNWVAWCLKREHTDGNYHRNGVPYLDEEGKAYGIGAVTDSTSRGDYFVDLEVSSPRQEFFDWADKSIPNNSHGHICPAGDNKWSKVAINQSFLLTNMCPQDYDMNSGIWEGLERRCRGWANRFGCVYIASGPIFYNGITKTMGPNKVGVPDAFFKVVLCMEKGPKALGFVIPNKSQTQDLDSYILSVDEVEEITGFDFFYNLPDDIESDIESKSNINYWK